MSTNVTILFLGAGLALGAASIPVLSECDASAEVKLRIDKDADAKVVSSFSGGADCFRVVVNQADGKEVRGYVIGRELDAVAAFEKERTDFLKDAMSRPPAVETPPPAPPPPAAKTEPATTESATVASPAPAPHAPKPPTALVQ